MDQIHTYICRNMPENYSLKIADLIFNVIVLFEKFFQIGWLKYHI